jgi:hypothetical protein
MTFIVDGTNGLTFNNSTTQASAGVVLQVVTGQLTSQASTASTSYVSTGLTATITPKFSTSKIIILYSAAVYNGANGGATYTTIYRGSTDISGQGAAGGGLTQHYLAGTTGWTSFGVNFIDSPATTSATTYTIYFKVNTNTGLFGNNTSGTPIIATINLLEIAG